LTGAEEKKLGNAGTSNPEAYRLYLEGRQQWYGRTPDGLKKSIDLFQRAIVADPNYALAYAGLADAYVVSTGYGVLIPPKQASALAEEAARKAVELDDSLSEAHAAKANSLTAFWKWDGAEAEYRRAIELNPNNASAHYFYGWFFLMPQNRISEALVEIERALALDPLSPIVNMNYGLTLATARRYPEAIDVLQKDLERNPQFRPAHFYISQVYAMAGRFPDAVREISEARKEGSRDALDPGSQSGDAQGFLKVMQMGIPGLNLLPPTNIAVAYALAGERGKAFENLETAYKSEDTELMACIRFPAFDSLHSDPRWGDLLRRVGLPQ
jgi:tetratricopeptide (TPR) repeat protein